MKILQGETKSPERLGMATKMAPAPASLRSHAALTGAHKALTIQPTVDGGALIASDVPEAVVAVESSGGGLRITEVLSDGTIAEECFVIPPIALSDVPEASEE